MHTTSRLALDVPDGTDQVSGYPAEAAQSLGVLDNAAMYAEGSLASRAATPTIDGQVYRAVDTAQLFVSSGGSWFEFERLANKGQAGGYPGLQSGVSSSVVAGQLGRVGYATNTGIWSLDNGSTLLPLGLATRTSGVSAAVIPGQFLSMNVASTTATLPATASLQVGTLVGVRAAPNIAGSGPITVAADSGASNIPLPGGSAAVSSFLLGGPSAFAVLVWNGSNWQCVAGGEDTGWVALTLGSHIQAGDAFTPSCRRVNGSVSFKGVLTTDGTHLAAGATLATVPSGFRPPSAGTTLNTDVFRSAAYIAPVGVGSGGALTTNTDLPAEIPTPSIPLNGCRYELVA